MVSLGKKLVTAGVATAILSLIPIGTFIVKSVQSRGTVKPVEPLIEKVKTVDYFAEIGMSYAESSPSAIAGDFDGDGDLDYIIVQKDGMGDNYNTKSYFMENDGKGNFKLRTYTK